MTPHNLEQIIARQKRLFDEEIRPILENPLYEYNFTEGHEKPKKCTEEDLKKVFNWHSSSIKEILEGEIQRKKDLLERCTECENGEIHDTNPTNKIHLADINHLEEVIKKL